MNQAQKPSHTSRTSKRHWRSIRPAISASQSLSLRSRIFRAVATRPQTASKGRMASRLNVGHQTFGQLVRFAIVGLFLAAVYSAIYWYLATYVMTPVLAVVIAFLVSVSIGFVLHSRWSFRGHGAEEDHRLKVKFLAVQFFGFILNVLFTWVLTGLMHEPKWW